MVVFNLAPVRGRHKTSERQGMDLESQRRWWSLPMVVRWRGCSTPLSFSRILTQLQALCRCSRLSRPIPRYPSSKLIPLLDMWSLPTHVADYREPSYHTLPCYIVQSTWSSNDPSFAE
jgi:hypothetical protein